jgi:flagellin
MRAKINGLNQAEMNVDDGIGLIQTADGAMTEIHAMLERGVTLSTQAANGTYNDVSRSAIQKELDELGGEIDRIFESTDFNGIKVLQGQHVTSETSRLEIIGGLPEDATFDSATAANGYVSKITTLSTPIIVTYTESGSTVEQKKTVNVDLDYHSAELDFTNYKDGATGAFNFTCCTCGLHYTANLVSGTDIKVEQSGLHTIYNIGVDGQTKDTIVNRIITAMNNGAPGNHYTHLKADPTDSKKLIIYDNRPISSSDDIKSAVAGAITSNQTYVKWDNADSTSRNEFRTLSNNTHGYVTKGLARMTTDREYEGTPDIILQIGPTDKETLVVKLPRVNTEALKVDEVKVDTVPNASDAMESYQKAIDQLSLERARLGAYENRLEHTKNYLGIASENTTAAESRIRDTDMAKEMAAYTKNNILAQAAQSMLAQANQSGQAVLSLLQG